MTAPMSAAREPAQPPLARRTTDLPAALGAALPAGFWSMPALVGVSGGADSTALLLALHRLAPADATARLRVVHAEHDLRAEAAEDGRFVADLAEQLGLSCLSRRLSVRGPNGGGEGMEGRARRLRYDFFVETARQLGARYVVVAHTADDQAETILHRALRGTGLDGLAGMREARPLCEGVALLRPLLRIARTDIRGFLAEVRGSWREDASNTDTAFARNFLRHEILARCVGGPYPAAPEALTRLGRQAAGVAAAVRSAAEHLLEQHSRRRADGTVVFDAAALSGLDRQLLAEVFVALWRREGWPQRDMTAVHYERLAAFLSAAAASAGGDYPGRVRVTAPEAGRLEVGRHPS